MNNTTSHQGRLKSLRAASIGNALEWFDWTLYATFSVYLASNLFDKTDARSAMLATLAVFAVGFVARPVGGWLFGRLSDRLGRRTIMVLTMLLLALSSLGIALIPDYQSIGLYASVALLFFRLIQGLAHGGETGVSYTYVAEIAPSEHRGLWSSSVYVGVTLGVMAATAVAALLTWLLGAQAMGDYGWRIGFAMGGVLGIYALFLRRGAQESHVFVEQQGQARPPRKLSTGEMLQVARNIVMLAAAANVTYYAWVTFGASTAIAQGMDATGAYVASLLAQILCVCWLPVCGMLSDRVGRRPMVIAWGLGVILLTYPISIMVTTEPYTLFLAQVLGLGAWSFIAAIFPAVLSEQVPTQARAQGVGLVSSVSVAIFGGTAPLSAQLSQRRRPWLSVRQLCHRVGRSHCPGRVSYRRNGGHRPSAHRGAGRSSQQKCIDGSSHRISRSKEYESMNSTDLKNPAARGERPGANVTVSQTSGPRQAARETWVEVPSESGPAAAWCYSDRRAYSPGDSVCLYLSSNRPQVKLRIYRDGAIARTLHTTDSLDARFHPIPERAYEQGCQWPVFMQWSIPADAEPGGYIVEVRDGDNSVLGHHLFIVKALRKSTDALVLVAATSTWAAYNDWGGANHYFGIHPDTPRGRSPLLSAQRPWARGQVWLPEGAPRCVNATRPRKPGPARYEFIEWASLNGYAKYYALAGWASYERPFVVWAEQQGYTVHILTQDDLHHDRHALEGYACAVFTGHDEYWTREMRDHVDAFVEEGGKVARFAGNFMWQIRLEDEGRRQVAYKYDAGALDPVAATEPHRLTGAWEDPRVNHPGARTFGVNALRGIYASFGGMAPRGPRGYTVFRPEHWAFMGTGLGYADMFADEANIFGYEVDGLEYTFVDGLPEPLGTDGAPCGLQILAMGFATNAEHGRAEDAYPFMLGDGDARFRASILAPDLSDANIELHSRGAGMVVHFHKGRGEVFTAATCEWVHGLMQADIYTVMITKNVLERFLRNTQEDR